jgi:hypothetical protein
LNANERGEIYDLAYSHLGACEAIYDAAIQRGDIDIAAHIARSALSVALNCVVDLGQEPSTETVSFWYERLAGLRGETTLDPDYLRRAIKWANRETRHIFGSDKVNDDLRMDQNW